MDGEGISEIINLCEEPFKQFIGRMSLIYLKKKIQIKEKMFKDLKKMCSTKTIMQKSNSKPQGRPKYRFPGANSSQLPGPLVCRDRPHSVLGDTTFNQMPQILKRYHQQYAGCYANRAH